VGAIHLMKVIEFKEISNILAVRNYAGVKPLSPPWTKSRIGYVMELKIK
jgi:hypothetical protein